MRSYNPAWHRCHTVWASPLSLATTQGMQSLSLFLRVHEMFQFPAFPCVPYVFRYACRGIARGGFPHSDIPGSLPVCGSPRLFAAYHVLRRLPAPRHPPYALCSLTNCLYFPLRASSMFPGIRLDCIHLPFCYPFIFPLRLFPYAVAKEHCPNHCIASTRAFFGGDDRTRTDDPLRAKQVLSQLSYIPIFTHLNFRG